MSAGYVLLLVSMTPARADSWMPEVPGMMGMPARKSNFPAEP